MLKGILERGYFSRPPPKMHDHIISWGAFLFYGGRVGGLMAQLSAAVDDPSTQPGTSSAWPSMALTHLLPRGCTRGESISHIGTSDERGKSVRPDDGPVGRIIRGFWCGKREERARLCVCVCERGTKIGLSCDRMPCFTYILLRDNSFRPPLLRGKTTCLDRPAVP